LNGFSLIVFWAGENKGCYKSSLQFFPEIIYTDKEKAWLGYNRVSDFGDPERANHSSRTIYEKSKEKNDM
jgi:hypothetical protein